MTAHAPARRRILCALTLCALAAGAGATGAQRSEKGSFLLSLESSLEPLAINVMHSWQLRLTDAAGAPISGARIEVSGGMPEHDHGLATAPRVTRDLGGGRYLLEGLRFHMAGRWVLVFHVEAAGETDRVLVEVTPQ